MMQQRFRDPDHPLARCLWYGAITPEGARPEAELNPRNHRDWPALLGRGAIREAAPGRYYAYRPTDDAGVYFLNWRPVRWILLALAVIACVTLVIRAQQLWHR